MGAIERIERDLAALAESLAKINSEFHTTYEGYLAALGQAAKQQLILACYHICTQGYPESFLQRSFNQRQKMQQLLRQLASASQAQLQLLVNQEEAEGESMKTEEESGQFQQSFSAILPPSTIPNSSAVVEFDPAQPSIPNPQPPRQPPLLTPERLLRWQENIERGIFVILKTLSRDANRLLQQSEILPSQLPEPVLEAASQAEVPGEAAAGLPNLLNLIVETEEPASSGGTTLHITAINLRLSEIEFADASVTTWRHQIRNLSVRLNVLRRDYQKKQRERAVLEAESAWRSSWFEE